MLSTVNAGVLSNNIKSQPKREDTCCLGLLSEGKPNHARKPVPGYPKSSQRTLIYTVSGGRTQSIMWHRSYHGVTAISRAPTPVRFVSPTLYAAFSGRVCPEPES